MSGELVGLVLASGPPDPLDRLLLVAVGETQRRTTVPGVYQPGALSLDDLAAAICRGRSATAVRLRRLHDAGWLLTDAGGGRGRKTRYRLVLGRFSTTPETVRPGPDSIDVPETVLSGPDSLGAKPSGLRAETVRPGPDTFRNVETPSSRNVPENRPESDPPQADDDDMRDALNGLPAVPWKRDLRTALRTALTDRGHTPASVNAFLRVHFRASFVGDPYAVVLTNLRAVPPAEAAKPKHPDWCGECHEATRLVDTDDGRARRCPRCHPWAHLEAADAATPPAEVAEAVPAAGGEKALTTNGRGHVNPGWLSEYKARTS